MRFLFRIFYTAQTANHAHIALIFVFWSTLSSSIKPAISLLNLNA